MRQILVAGNWKLNGTKESIQTLVKGIADGMSDVGGKAVAICPPYVYIPMVADLVEGTDIGLGSQDVADQETGAFTGEISAAMLKEVGCQYAIVGHSERRSIYGEKDADTATKYAAARKEGLTPILCLGELLEERESGNTEKVVARQLDAVLELEGVASLADAVIAYEPVWAIGTGVTASPEQAQEVHAFIRSKIAELDADVAAKVQILYGGSVNGGNAAELFAMEDIDGGLIGGASLTSEAFLAICTA